MTTSMAVSLGTNTEMRSEKQGFEPLVLTAQTKPIKADEVLCTLKLSKLPGGVAPGNRALSGPHTPGLPITQRRERKAAW